MVTVKFISRSDAKVIIEEGYFKSSGYDLISISDTNKEKEEMRDMWKNNKCGNNAALFFNFQDIDDRSSGFNSHKARQIIDFVEESVKKGKHIIVHCFLGVSRSGGVAKFINDYWMLGDKYLEDYQGHNRWVYYELLEEAGVETLRSYYNDLEKVDENN